jgi:23S rRNA (adenine2503-C2)-methyltransferase
MNRDLAIAARHLTISTVGVVPGIRQLASKALQVNLAVSLHAANDSLRDELVPLNRRYPIASVIEACELYRSSTGRRISFEWACIEGVNDRPSDAFELAALARPLGAHVNLIPLNPTPGGASRGLAGSSRARVLSLQAWLRQEGVNVTIRQNRGRSIDAACGQLAAGGLPIGRRMTVGRATAAAASPSPARTCKA